MAPFRHCCANWMGELYLRYTETSSNRIFVTVECLYGFKVAIAAGLKRIVKP